MAKIRVNPNNTRQDPTTQTKKKNTRAICRFCKNRLNKHCPECKLCPGYHLPGCEEQWK